MSTITLPAAQAAFGIIGLGVMGENLALNLKDNGHRAAVWNPEPEWVDRFIHSNPRRQAYQRADRPETGFVHTDRQALLRPRSEGGR